MLTKLYSPDISELSTITRMTLIKGPDWSFDVIHTIDNAEMSTLIMTKKVPNPKSKGHKSAEVFVIQFATKDWQSSSDNGIDVTVLSEYGNPYSEDGRKKISNGVESMTEEILVKLVRRNARNRYDCQPIALTHYNVLQVCEAIPVEIREWLIFNGGIDALKDEMAKARRELRSKIKTAIEGIVGAEVNSKQKRV